MSKVRPTIGTDGRPLPVFSGARRTRLGEELVRVMFYMPGFLVMLLLKAERAGRAPVSLWSC